MKVIKGDKRNKVSCEEHGDKYMIWTPDISDKFPELGQWICLVCASTGPVD